MTRQTDYRTTTAQFQIRAYTTSERPPLRNAISTAPDWQNRTADPRKKQILGTATTSEKPQYNGGIRA